MRTLKVHLCFTATGVIISVTETRIASSLLNSWSMVQTETLRTGF